jgi:hypothetical protein
MSVAVTTTAATPAFATPASARVHPTTTATAPAATIPRTAVLPGGSAVKPFNSTTVIGRPRAPAHTSGSGGVSTEAVVLAEIAVLLLLACAAWAFARARAYEPHWLLSLRHAMAEAGFRTSATWAEFTDWARLGR